MIRVVVAEDSPTARALIVAVLRSDTAIAVVGEARTGAEAVEMAGTLRPDLVTMDIEMPVMDGLEAARQIMERAPVPIVVVSSATNRQQTNRSMDAIAAGALAVIDKPAHPLAARFDDWRELLLTTVKAMAHVKVVRRMRRRSVTTPVGTWIGGDGAHGAIRLIAMAASTGGPAALHEILRKLPRNFPVPILVVQHIAHGFATALADWLDDSCQLRVKVAAHEEPLLGGTVYLAPDDRQLGVERGAIELSDALDAGAFRPSATHLFTVTARVYGRAVVGVILTGMGADGVEGLRELHAAGGKVFAQDEASCVVYGMPREAVRAGIVDAVLSPPAIADQLLLLARRIPGAHTSPRR